MAMSHPHLLQQFLKQTGWPAPKSPEVARRMQAALEFFHKRLATWINLPLDASDKGYKTHGLNPYAFKMQGKATKLTGAMQAINFTCPVEEKPVTKGEQLWRYAKPADKRGERASGLWYTKKGVEAAKLALPPDQTAPHGYEVMTTAPALWSTAGDLLVDWNMSAPKDKRLEAGVDYHYRHGGGVQCVLPNARDLLRPL